MRAPAVMRAIVVASTLSMGVTTRVFRRASKASQAQQRMELWHHEYTHAPRQTAASASLISLREEPKVVPAAKERKLFFERDHAGFNNIKMQLQSLVAIAAVTGRTLVLPPPTHADHLDHAYFEFDFFDPAALKSVVSVQIEGAPDGDTLVVHGKLADLDIRKLDQDRDWLFKMWDSRIQHFECLQLSLQDHAYAAHAVLHGLVFDHRFEEKANADLQKLNLSTTSLAEGAKGEADFDCVHIRRGDFVGYGPNFYLDDKQVASTLKGMLSGRPVLVVSDVSLSLDLGTSVLFAKDAYSAEDDEETRVAVDMVMCSRARDFIGSPVSTFTNGIAELRNRRAVLRGDPTGPSRLYLGSPNVKATNGTMCWDKQTTFDDVKLCKDVKAPVCVAQRTARRA